MLLIANAVNYDGTDERVDEAWADAVGPPRPDDGRPGAAGSRRWRRPTTSRPRRRTRATGRRRGLPRRGGARQGGDPRRRGLPGRRRRSGSTMPTAGQSRWTSTGCCARSNPSPYMYLLRFDGFDVVGSSPEALVKVNDGQALLHPIAGTRWRGATPEEDDPARRGAARRREGARRAPDAGRPRPQRPGPGLRAGHASRSSTSCPSSATATSCTSCRPSSGGWRRAARRTTCWPRRFPAGTLSGAPKPRAMEIIEELEPTRRGLYGGARRLPGLRRRPRPAIAIRTALLRDGVAYVQAGGGHRRRLRPGGRGHRVAQQGGRRPARGRRRRHAAPGRRLRERGRSRLRARRGPAWSCLCWGCVGAGARAADACRLTWGRVGGAGATSSRPSVLTGRGGAHRPRSPLSLAALAGLGVLLLVGRGPGRAVVGALLVLLGAGTALAAAAAALDLRAAERWRGQAGQSVDARHAGVARHRESRGGRWVGGARRGCSSCAGAGALAVRGGPAGRTPSAATARRARAERRPRDPWRALDRGRRPTLDDLTE